MSKQNKLLRGASIFAGLTILAFAALVGRVESQTSTAPQYTSGGDLLLPVDFEKWVFVGSNLGLGYRQGVAVAPPAQGARVPQQQFHNVYINPEAYAHFRATREFPVPTILVMAKFVAADKEPRGIVATGVFNGDPTGLEVAVKNLPRHDAKGTTAWAYYDFTNAADPSKPPASASPFPDEACQNCHREHASRDNVWVQFYPTLRNLIR
jgi:hypothetical protein